MDAGTRDLVVIIFVLLEKSGLWRFAMHEILLNIQRQSNTCKHGRGGSIGMRLLLFLAFISYCSPLLKMEVCEDVSVLL